MIAGALVVLAGLGVLAWYMQRRDPPVLRLSFARLLPDPPEEMQKQPRFSLVPPVGSLAFWLHLLAVLACLGALWLDWTVLQRRAAEAVGLRIVLDVSHSMSLPVPQGGTRLDQARAVAGVGRDAGRAAAGEEAYCEELLLVAGGVELASALDAAVARRQGAQTPQLLAAAGAETRECQVTHALVVSDQPRPALPWPDDGPELIWRQVGAALPNAGISWLRFRPPSLTVRGAQAEIGVVTYGGAEPRALRVDGPGGTVAVPLESSPDRPGLAVGRFVPPGSGRYGAVLEGGGAYAGDDRVVFDLAVPPRPWLDWRLESLPAPPVAETGADGVLVTPAERLGADSRPAVAVFPGWEGGGTARMLGAFVEGDPVLSAVNLDVLERVMPRAFDGPLPEGFAPVLTDDRGGVLIARRETPPGYLVPQPELRGDPDVVALSQTLFFTALDTATRGAPEPVGLRWQMPKGQEVAEARLESNTATAPEDGPAPVLIALRREGARQAPVWPWLALAALALLLLERGWAVWRAWNGRGRHAV